MNSFLNKVGAIYGEEESLKRLSKANEFSTIGDYISAFSKAFQYQSREILTSIGINSADANAILNNTKPITSFSIKQVTRLCQELRLSYQNAEALIRNSVASYNLSPLITGGMARYDVKKGADQKDESMKRGLTELLLKASQKKPILVSNKVITDEELNTYLLKLGTELSYNERR